MRILRSISFALTSVIHKLIPDLYNVFETLASNKFFSEENIATISNNIYILVSVIMLFAFGIKLISTIVNPDLIDDKKKGTGKTFVNAIIAVILITIIPLGFRLLYQAQDNLLSNHLVEKIIFGMDVDNDNNRPGQVLAGYTFSTFCYPNPDLKQTTTTTISNTGGDYYNKTVTEDIKNIDKVDGSINNRIDDEWELEYNIILSPLAGGYVAYELILMCIDIAFRSIKLGLLQLMAPLVICAFVFAGQDLLVRWFKEVVSTFVLVFVKIAAVTFMIYGLSLLPSFWKNIGGVAGITDNWFARGFIYIVILIGLLQLVKKLPDIINKIFGTDIKMSGGIGDRLGEMAGIGNLAKGAWDKVKTTTGRIAGKVGKAGALGAAVALNPLGAGLIAGAAGSVGYGWRRGFGNGAWKDRSGGRRLRTFGAGAHAIWKGLSGEGGIIKGVQSGIKDYNESEIATINKSVRKDNIVKNANKRFGIGEDGRIENVSAAIAAGDNELATTMSIIHMSNLRGNIDATLRDEHLNPNTLKHTQELAAAIRDKEIADGIKSKYDSINSKLQSFIDSETDGVKQEALRNLKGRFLSSKASGLDVVNEVRTILGEGAAGDVNADVSKLDNLLKTRSVQTGEVFSDIMRTTNDDGTKSRGISIGYLGDQITAFNNRHDSVKTDLDNDKEIYKLNDYQKQAIDKAITSATTTAKTYVATQSKIYIDDNDVL